MEAREVPPQTWRGCETPLSVRAILAPCSTFPYRRGSVVGFNVSRASTPLFADQPRFVGLAVHSRSSARAPPLRLDTPPRLGVTARRAFATLRRPWFRSRQRTDTSVKVFLSYAHTDAAIAERVCAALADSGLEVSDPRRDHLPGDNWAEAVARALEESEAMVVLLTPAAALSPEVKRNIEYALGSKNYSNRLIPVVVGDHKRFPVTVIPWIVRRMPWFELDDTEPPKVEPIAEAILSHA